MPAAEVDWWSQPVLGRDEESGGSRGQSEHVQVSTGCPESHDYRLLVPFLSLALPPGRTGTRR